MSGDSDLRVSIKSDDGSVRTVELRGERFVIGRQQGAAIALDHPTVSRQHAELFRDPFGRWWVRDLLSRHGTFVNDQPVTERVLTERDTLRVGDSHIEIRAPVQREPSSVGAKLPTVPFGADITDGEIATVDPEDSVALTGERLRALITLSGELNAELEPQNRMRLLCATLGNQIPDESSVLVLRVDRTGLGDVPTQLCRVDGGSPRPAAPVHVSRTLLELVSRKRQPAIASNVALPAIDARLSISPMVRPLVALACPLEERDGGFDLLYVLMGPQFAAGEWLSLVRMAATLYQQAEATRRLHDQLRAHEIIERDLERARHIQTQLLPREIRCEGWDLAIGFQPCRWVGGDYVDVIACPDGRLLLVIADVCGKGLSAALITGNVHAVIHANAARGIPLTELVGNANTYLERTLLDDSFVTLLAVRIDPASGEYECVAAGHPRPRHIDAQGVIRIAPVGLYPPLGVFSETYEPSRGKIAKGEWLLCLTDGVTDTCRDDGARLEDEGFAHLAAQVFREHRDASAKTLIRNLEAEIESYQGAALPIDDRTFLAARRLM